MAMCSEKEIENAILDYLSFRNDVFAWKNQSTGIYDPIKKCYRKSNNKHHINGVADILGLFRGRPLAIEVKAARGRATPSQMDFLFKFHKMGGIAIIARNVMEVKIALDSAAGWCGAYAIMPDYAGLTKDYDAPKTKKDRRI
jgi:hypothetical protein